MNIISRAAISVMLVSTMAGCTAQHLANVRDDDERMTVGTVQKEISVGTPAAQVAEILGSPNIVTTDEERRETWVYDKISTEVAYSRSGGSIIGLIFGGSGGGGGSVRDRWRAIGHGCRWKRPGCPVSRRFIH